MSGLLAGRTAVVTGAANGLMTRMWNMSSDPAAARLEMEAAYPLGRLVELGEVADAALFLARVTCPAPSMVQSCRSTAA